MGMSLYRSLFIDMSILAGEGETMPIFKPPARR